jgi:hypothetical protein
MVYNQLKKELKAKKIPLKFKKGLTGSPEF